MLELQLESAYSFTEESWLNSTTPTHRQFSFIRRTQSQNINVSRLVLLLSLPNPLKPGVRMRMKM